MSWGHDEYLYHVTKDYLPEPAQYMIRYHSFYAWHREGAYGYLLDDTTARCCRGCRSSIRTTCTRRIPTAAARRLKPYYEDLIAKYLPATIRF